MKTNRALSVFKSPPWTLCLPPPVQQIKYVTTSGGNKSGISGFGHCWRQQSVILPQVCRPAPMYTQFCFYLWLSFLEANNWHWGRWLVLTKCNPTPSLSTHPNVHPILFLFVVFLFGTQQMTLGPVDFLYFAGPQESRLFINILLWWDRFQEESRFVNQHFTLVG